MPIYLFYFCSFTYKSNTFLFGCIWLCWVNTLYTTHVYYFFEEFFKHFISLFCDLLKLLWFKSDFLCLVMCEHFTPFFLFLYPKQQVHFFLFLMKGFFFLVNIDLQCNQYKNVLHHFELLVIWWNKNIYFLLSKCTTVLIDFLCL